mmetsp:Transcript_346/g.598  ORF Transcript_346/g.598 Transcript_346/m.598 type:complete len:275 (-) Transcript_346:754-1578(-)
MPDPVLRPRLTCGGGRCSPEHLLPPSTTAATDFRPPGITPKGTHPHLPGRHGSRLGAPSRGSGLSGSPWPPACQRRRRPQISLTHLPPACVPRCFRLRPTPEEAALLKRSRWAPLHSLLYKGPPFHLSICYTYLSPRPPPFAIVHLGRSARFRSFPPSSISPWPSMGFFEVIFRDSGWQPFSKSLATHSPCKTTSTYFMGPHRWACTCGKCRTFGVGCGVTAQGRQGRAPDELRRTIEVMGMTVGRTERRREGRGRWPARTVGRFPGFEEGVSV